MVISLFNPVTQRNEQPPFQLDIAHRLHSKFHNFIFLRLQQSLSKVNNSMHVAPPMAVLFRSQNTRTPMEVFIF
jgi:hypothetical protein